MWMCPENPWPGRNAPANGRGRADASSQRGGSFPASGPVLLLLFLLVVVAIIVGWLDAAWLLYVIPGEIIIWVAHRDNIGRLLAGEERKFQPGDRTPTPLPGAQDDEADSGEPTDTSP